MIQVQNEIRQKILSDLVLSVTQTLLLTKVLIKIKSQSNKLQLPVEVANC